MTHSHNGHKDVVKFLRLASGGRATESQITKRLGYRPDFEALEGSGTIRRPEQCPNHWELVPASAQDTAEEAVV